MTENTKDKDCLDPENNSKFCFFKVANAFLLLANFFLILLGFVFLPHDSTEKTSGDILSIIVSVLAILVTALIGWQIVQTLESKRALEKFEKTTKDYEKDLQSKVDEIRGKLFKKTAKMQGKTKSEVIEFEGYIRGKVASEIYDKIFLLNDPLRDFYTESLYDFLIHSIQGLKYGLIEGDAVYCKSNIIAMNRWLRNAQKNYLTDEQISEIHNQLKKIDDKLGSMKSYGQFKDRFSEIFPPF